MEYPNRFYALVCGVAFCVLGSAAASPPGTDSRLLSLVPPGAAIVAGLTQGTPASYLVLTRNNATDLTDFLSIAGVDPTRRIWRVTLFAVAGDGGFIVEHSLLASGQFDSSHIFKAGRENGATESRYLGIPVLIIPPLDRDKGISRDIRWLAFLDSQIAVFGTVPTVREELSRYLRRSPVDWSLTQHLSRLRSMDQSWCVLSPTIYNREIDRRRLAALDPSLSQLSDSNDGLIMGIHFGRNVEIEYESIPDSGDSEASRPRTEPEFSVPPLTKAPLPVSSLFNNSQTIPHKVIRLSQKQYEEFVAQEENQELSQRRTGVERR